MIGQNILQALKHKGVSQYKAAKDLNLGASRLNQYISGARTPDPDTIVRLCAYLGVSADYLFGMVPASMYFKTSDMPIIGTQAFLVKKRFESLLKKKNISLQEAAEYCSRSVEYLENYIQQDVPKRLDDTARLKLAHLLGVDEQELTDEDLSEQKTLNTYNTEILGEILQSIEEWLQEHDRQLSAYLRLRLMFSMYEKVLKLPKEELKAQVKYLTDFVYDTIKSA